MEDKAQIVTMDMFKALERKFRLMSEEIKNLKKEVADLKKENKQLKKSSNKNQPQEEVELNRKLREVPEKTSRRPSDLKEVRTNFKVACGKSNRYLGRANLPAKAYHSDCNFVHERRKRKLENKENSNFEVNSDKKTPGNLKKERHSVVSIPQKSQFSLKKHLGKSRGSFSRINSLKKLNNTETSDYHSNTQKEKSTTSRKPQKPKFHHIKSRINTHLPPSVPSKPILNPEEHKDPTSSLKNNRSGYILPHSAV
ncbi:unnamed protein product [Moneuplotes crassus]|uniref:Uncharacterized protein n=1 Tax=Euplotes crassus TaxID=5936 RepID=A0AAD2CYG7_EUPCR|nr:unnamed protein product [Moneuplotes crassus]